MESEKTLIPGGPGESRYGEGLTPVSRLVETQVVSAEGISFGKVRDVVVRWDGGQDYPIVLGVVVDSDNELGFAPIAAMALPLQEPSDMVVKLDRLGAWKPRTGELCLIQDILGRQILDVDGVEVFRAKELFLAPVFGSLHLVAVSGKKKAQYIFNAGEGPAKGKIVDWAMVQPFGEKDSELRLRLPHDGLRKLRPRELARILEELDSAARHELTSQIDLEQVADAMEEMEPEEIGEFLVDTDPKRAAEILASMEPDEAVDALRDLGRSDADEVLSHMPEEVSDQLNRLLDYPEAMVGGFMTTRLITAKPTDTIEEVRRRLRASRNHSTEIDAIVVTDENGRFITDISLFDLAAADEGNDVGSLLSEIPPVTLEPEAFVNDAVDALRESRRSSVVVVDEQGIPIGRVLADDLVDALAKSSGFHFRLPWMK